METTTPKTTQKLIGLFLLIVLFFLYGDQVTIYPKSNKLAFSKSWVPKDPRTNVQKIQAFFEINMGQTHPSVKYLSRGRNHTLFLTPHEAVLCLSQSQEPGVNPGASDEGQIPQIKGTRVCIRMIGSNPAVELSGINQLAGRSNYLIGKDTSRWQKNIPHFEMVKYSNVYDGIDLVYHTKNGHLEYDFNVAPGADPGKIRLKITGVEDIIEDKWGNLLLATKLGDIKMKVPVTFQESKGSKEYIASKFNIDRDGQIAFQVDQYDKSLPLVIDPELLFSTYLGGQNDDGGTGIDADDEGNAYICGFTNSADFPSGNGNTTYAGEFDGFISKLNTVSSEVVFTTYIGGTYSDLIYDIGLDLQKNISLTGWTCSDDMPVHNAIQSELGDGFPGSTDDGDAFVIKLDASGSSIVYSTYLGGRERESVFDAVFETGGNVFLTGYTGMYYDEAENLCSNQFPLHPKEWEEYSDLCGAGKRYVAKINSTGGLEYSVLVDDVIPWDACLAINNSGDAYLLRWNHRANLPDPAPPRNLYTIVVFNSSGTMVDSLSMLFGSDDISTWGYDLLIDDQENIHITGMTESGLIPITANAFQSSCVGTDAFIVKLNKDASEVLYGTYIGGAGYDLARILTLDKVGRYTIYGETESEDFPLENAFQSSIGGQKDVFLATIDPSLDGAASLLFSTYLGGEKYDWSTDLRVDKTGNMYITGRTFSDEFPVKNEIIGSLPGTNSAFVTIFGAPFINLIYDKVVILGPPIFTPLLPPNTQQVLPQFLLHDTLFFQFEGRSTDSRVGLRVTNTFVDPEPPLVLDMEVTDPEGTVIPTWTIHNIGEGNRGVQFDVTKNGIYTVKVWADLNLSDPPAPFQIHLAGNVGWPQPLLFPIPDPPPQGIPDRIRATRQDILINAPAPRPQLVRGKLGQIIYDPSVEISQTSLFKFVNIFRVSEHAVAVLTPFNVMGFEQGRAPVRMLDPNPMLDITTPTAPFNNSVSFPCGGYVVDFTQVPIPAAINVPVQLRHAAVLGKSDGISASLPVQIPYKNGWVSTSTFILDMGSGQEIVNGEGNDFQVISPDGNYQVAVSNTVFANTFVPIGETSSGDQEFDLEGSSLSSARYVRIIADETVSIDAVKALNFFCDEIRTDIGPISKVSHITLTARRSKAPQTLFDPLIELIGPDGALNATNESGFGDDLSQNSSDAALINMELNQEGFYRYLGRGHDKVPNEESFGAFYTRFESAGSYDQNEINVSELKETDLTAQRKVNLSKRRQRDSYLFQAAPNQIINISVSSSDIDVMLELYDPEGFLIAASDNHPGRLSNALISVRLPDSSFVGQAPLPAINTYRLVVSAIDLLEDKKSGQAGGAYVRKAAVGEYAMKVFTSENLVGVNDRQQGSFMLRENYPNPFSQHTTLIYELPVSVHVFLEIYDLNGRMIKQLVNETQAPGQYSVDWNGNDRSGHMMPDGVYISRMRAGEFTSSKTMMLYR